MLRRDTVLARLLDLGTSRSPAEDATVTSLLAVTPVVFRVGPDVVDANGNRYLRADLGPAAPGDPECLLVQVADFLVAQGAGVVVSSRPDGGGRHLVGLGALDCLRQHGSFEPPEGLRCGTDGSGVTAVLSVGERIEFLQPLRGFLRSDVARAFDLRLACSGWLREQRRIAIMRSSGFGGRHAVVFARPVESFSSAAGLAAAHQVLSWHLFPGVVFCLLPERVLAKAVGFVGLAELALTPATS